MQRFLTGVNGASAFMATAFASSSSSLLRRPQSATHGSEVPHGLTHSNAGSLSSVPSASTAVATAEQRRGRFYRPALDSGYHLFKLRWGFVRTPQQTFRYQRTAPVRRPLEKDPVNPQWGRSRLYNPIPSRIGIVNKKASDWGYPERRPPPAGIRKSAEFFPHFFEKYFPAEECRLVIDSVLNTDSTKPVFHFPPHMSKREIHNYLKNIYGLDNIIKVTTRNVKGRFFKNEIGKIKSLPDYKEATVVLDAPVRVDFKQIKGTEDTPDNKKLT